MAAGGILDSRTPVQRVSRKTCVAMILVPDRPATGGRQSSTRTDSQSAPVGDGLAPHDDRVRDYVTESLLAGCQ